MIGRRLLLKGLAVMTGDGLVRPMNAPGGGQPVPGIQPGSQGVVNANRVLVGGANGGIFVYDANGVLVDSIVALNGQDPVNGSAVYKGITSYDQGQGLFAELDSAQLSISTITGINRVALLSVITPTSGMQLSGFNGAAVSTLYLIGDAKGSVVVAGVLVAQQPGAIAATPEVWQSLGTLAGYTVTFASFRLAPDGFVDAQILVVGGGANAAQVQFSTVVPAAYRLSLGAATSTAYPLAVNGAYSASTSARAIVATSGAVLISYVANHTQLLSGGFRYPTALVT